MFRQETNVSLTESVLPRVRGRRIAIWVIAVRVWLARWRLREQFRVLAVISVRHDELRDCHLGRLCCRRTAAKAGICAFLPKHTQPCTPLSTNRCCRVRHDGRVAAPHVGNQGATQVSRFPLLHVLIRPILRRDKGFVHDPMAL